MTWGQRGQFTLPPGTVVLKYKAEVGSMLKSTPLDYPVMSPPATRVLHPLWALGRYPDQDEEHIYYRFDGNEVHTGGKKTM